MTLLKKTTIALIAVVLLAVICIYGYLLSIKPTYEGQIALKNIDAATTVYFDDFGIPHIYANTEHDAMVAFGYVHAQDRLWQMELLKRIAPGKLSEIFGTVMLKNDLFFSSLGIDEASEKAVAEMDKSSNAYQLTLAYLQGINQFIEEGKTPIEYQLLGIEKQKLTIKDVFNIFGYMSFSFAMAQKTDPLLTDIRDKFGSNYLKDFGIDGSLGTQQLKSFNGISNNYSAISKSITSLLENGPVAPFIGSNSWVIGAQKTKNGKVIFENDPHIGFSQPGTWYEAHIKTPNYEMYGYHLAGTPFPLLGHNRSFAYGLTMFENDDLDFFEEVQNPKNANQYKTAKGFKNYKIISKTIKIKDSTAVTIRVKYTIHGPIMSGVLNGLPNKKLVALSWIYTQHKNHIVDAVYNINHATNLDAFKNAVALIHAPGLNFMYGDAKNNIAWITSGKLYQVDQSINTNFILNGSNGIDDKKEFIDFKNHPMAINPPSNYVYSANNQTEAVNGYLYPGYYLPKDRATRIEKILLSKNNWTKSDVCNMTLDTKSITALENIRIFLNAVRAIKLSNNEQKAIAIIKKWNGTNELNQIEPTIYNKLLYFYLKNTFEDELGSDDFKALLATHTIKQVINSQLKNLNSPWWDAILTKNRVEKRDEILIKSFKETVASLQEQLGSDVSLWTWNRVHTLEIQHPLGKIYALKGLFNVAPASIAGSCEVLNNLMFTYSDNNKYEVKAGPSTRRVIDFSDIENALSIIPSGQSGNPMSQHYRDQAQMYVDGKFRKMKLNKAEIIKTSTKLVFKPAKI